MAVEVSAASPDSIAVADTAGGEAAEAGGATFVAFYFSDSGRDELTLYWEKWGGVSTCRSGSRFLLWGWI